MRLRIFASTAQLRSSSKGSHDDSSSNHTPNVNTVKTGNNLGNLKILSKEVARMTVTSRFFQGLMERKVGTKWVEATALHS